MNTFAEKLKAARKRLGITQADADGFLETCRGQVAAWERGRNVPHVLTQEAAIRRLESTKPKTKP
jgi:DNA-binding transcriptional regulator YiaG